MQPSRNMCSKMVFQCEILWSKTFGSKSYIVFSISIISQCHYQTAINHNTSQWEAKACVQVGLNQSILIMTPALYKFLDISITKLETSGVSRPYGPQFRMRKQHTHPCSQRPAPSVTSLNTYDNRCRLAPAAPAKSMCLRSVKTARHRRSTLTQTRSETFQIQQICTVCQGLSWLFIHGICSRQTCS